MGIIKQSIFNEYDTQVVGSGMDHFFEYLCTQKLKWKLHTDGVREKQKRRHHAVGSWELK